jgi:hypothetical protein
MAERLRSLLELPVELVLATHGGPTDKAALERALARRSSRLAIQVCTGGAETKGWFAQGLVLPTTRVRHK